MSHSPGDTIHLSNIDIIDGTPVLDIKPYIPEYDSPHTRIVMDSEPYDSNTNQQHAAALSLHETTALLKDSETDAPSDPNRARNDDDDDFENPLQRDATEADSSRVTAQFSLPKDLHDVLEDVKAYVTLSDLCKMSCEDKGQVSDSTKTKLPESTLDHPCYGEEAYSTIAGWIREPPVSSLEVRLTPHAQRELAEFLPSHLSGKPDSQGALEYD